MKNNYLLTIFALVVMQLSMGWTVLNKDSGPPDQTTGDISPITSTKTVSEEKEIEGFKMYPNPVTNGTVTITSAKNLEKQIKILDILGNEVLSTTLISNPLNLSSLVPGVYFIKVSEKGDTTIRKLVIK